MRSREWARRGHRRGAPPAPAASQLSAPELDTGLLARRPAWVVATSGLTPSTGDAGGGRGRGRGRARAARGGWGRGPGAPRPPGVFRVPERPSLRHALQALPTNWSSKEVCGFPSFPLSLPSVGTKTNEPRTGSLEEEGACSAAEDFHQGCLSRSAAARPAAQRESGQQQTLYLPPSLPPCLPPSLRLPREGTDGARVPLW